MLNAIKSLAEEILRIDKPVRIISHHDTDGITSAAIIAKTLKKLNRKFTVRIIKNLEKEIIEKEIKKHEKELIFFTDLASGSLKYFTELKEVIFIIDHHEINKEELNSKVRIINPHLFNEEEICSAEISYLFAKAISEENKDLAKLAVIGMIGDRLEENISKISQQIINDAKDIEIKKGLLIFSATRPLRRALEYSTSFYIPKVTGCSTGVIELLKETNIPQEKTLCELSSEEMSRLLTSIMIRRVNYNKKEEIIGNIYLLKFYNKKEDVRELSTTINACSRLGYPDIALAFCLENEKIKDYVQEIYTEYKQQLISALNIIEKMEKIKGNGFVILNAKGDIKDTIIGTVTSILSSSLDYEEGTILIGMAYNQDKIKVSARIVGKKGRNLKEFLEKINLKFNGEVGGHKKAAGCLIKKEQETEFISELKKNLEIEIIKL